MHKPQHAYICVGKAMAGGQPDNHAAHGMGGGEPPEDREFYIAPLWTYFN